MRSMTRLLVFVLFSISASAATFIVPSDKELVGKARRIVTATVIDSQSRYTPEGSIETVTVIEVTETLKGGSTIPGERTEIVHIGGAMSNLALVVPGSPNFEKGESVLLFLTRNGRDEWTTVDLVLGKFARRGQLLVREEGEIAGADREGRAHKERNRSADRFTRYVQAVANGEAPEPDYYEASPSLAVGANALTIAPNASVASAYLLTVAFCNVPTQNPCVSGTTTRPYRWDSFGAGIVFDRGNSHGSYQNGGADAVVAATAAWTNDCASNVAYSAGNLKNGQTKGFKLGSDGFHTVIFDDPNDEIPGAFAGSGTLAIGGTFIFSDTHVFNGETFYTSAEAEVIVQNGVALSNFPAASFNEMMTHEIGHTLGFRHSNQGTPNTIIAIMSSTVSNTFGTTLQPYDVDAVRAVYASGVCNGVPILGDVNGDGIVNGTDLTAVQSTFQTARGAVTAPTSTSDCDGNGTINSLDVLCVFNKVNVPTAVFVQTTLKDVDADGRSDALTDGLLVLRRLFGFGGTTLTNAAIGPTANRSTSVDLQTYVDGLRPVYDIDRNGTTDALTDGLLLLRFQFGFRGTTLINGALGPGALRTTAADIEAYLNAL